MPAPPCRVCGNDAYTFSPVLWDGLATEWQLSPEERAYVDRQQGMNCTGCGSNLRSIVLAEALCAAVDAVGTLESFVASPQAARWRLLEINEAGTLGPLLARMPDHVLAAYPAVDMHDLPWREGSFDLVVHSDTLEHVAQPVRALAECRRVLRPGGWLCFTIPTIVGRLTRSRAGLGPSHHGDPAVTHDDYLVHTEFGADMWTFVLRAGFTAVTLHATSFPDALALSARR